MLHVLSKMEEKYLVSQPKYKEGAEEYEPRGTEAKTEVDRSVEGCLPHNVYLFFPCSMYQTGKGLFPGEHLYHLHPVDNLVHESYSEVGLLCSLHPESAKLVS